MGVNLASIMTLEISQRNEVIADDSSFSDSRKWSRNLDCISSSKREKTFDKSVKS